MCSFQSWLGRLKLPQGLFNWYLCSKQHADVHFGNIWCQSLCKSISLSSGHEAQNTVYMCSW